MGVLDDFFYIAVSSMAVIAIIELMAPELTFSHLGQPHPEFPSWLILGQQGYVF